MTGNILCIFCGIVMRVMLVNPPVTAEAVYGRYAAAAPCLPPLGLCYLAAVLEENGYEVRIVDGVAQRISLSELKDEITGYSPHVVGVTSTTCSYPRAKEVLRLVKECDSQIMTVLGGAHLSARPVETMRECENLDIGVYGEGEYSLLEIVQKVDRHEHGLLTDIPGTVVRQGDAIILNRPREPIGDLDELPLPARHLLGDMQAYSHTPLRGSRHAAAMIATRGCPFGCSYCDQSVFGRRRRSHGPGRVVQEMLLLRDTYGADYVSFEDDSFIISKAQGMDLSREMIAKQVNLPWGCSVRVNLLDAEILSLMREAGCRLIYIGIESGSERILKLINKGITLEQVRDGVNLIKRFGIRVYGSFMIGLPSETVEEMEMTVNFALSLPLDGVSFFLYTPYPNTELVTIAPEYGDVSGNWRDYSAHPVRLPYIPHGLNEELLLKMQRRAYLSFYLRIPYILKHLDIALDWSLVEKGLLTLKATAVKGGEIGRA